jgi:hypothetical protein
VRSDARVLGPHTLARALRRAPPLPTGVVHLLGNLGVELAFRELVRRLLPGEVEAILRPASAGTSAGHRREAERAWAFCSAFERRYFPIFEVEEIEYLVACVPFQRMGWSYDAFHELDQRPGTLMLRALCAEPYEANLGARVSLLETVQNLGVPRELLLRVPEDGLPPTALHAALDGTPHAAAAEFADWTWGQTDTAFLDFDDDMEISDADWSDEIIQELTQQWRKADAIMSRVAAIEAWLERDPANHFAVLLEAATARLPALDDEGRPHAQEIPELQSNAEDAQPGLTLSPAAAA